MPLQILKASAGSGKTYTLTESYVMYCLDDKNDLNFTNILAITFTNKASGEMKDRIIDLFHTLSFRPNTYSGIESISQTLGLSIDQIQKRSQKILNRILRDFDLFSITTIDSFFTRLNGSMTLDLFGDPPRDITFDTDRALNYATDRLLEATQSDEELKTVVIDVLEEKIREGEGIGMQNSLKKLGKELFNDEYLQLSNESHYAFPAKDIHQALTQAVDLIQFNFQQYQNDLEALLIRGGMDHGDFFSGLIGWILNKDNPLELYKLSSFNKITDPDQWFAKKNKDEMLIKVAPIQNDLLELGVKFYDYVQRHYRLYTTYSTVLDNYASYRILQFLDLAVKQYLQEQKLIFLSDINININRHISSEDSVIVYEKLGQRLHAIMIDEFQDTSQIQWNNLKPLIQNSMAEGYPNLVVGDVKQAIYRFRSGNWEIMEIQVPAFKEKLDEKEKPANLPTNWRSSPEIVTFNNSFFSQISETLADIFMGFQVQYFPEENNQQHTPQMLQEMKKLAEAPRLIYGDSSQNIAESNSEKPGYVELSYWSYERGTDKIDIEEARMEWLKRVIEELNRDGYRGSDIGILARGKKELTRISESLTKWSEETEFFKFSSEDSLKLDLSDAIQLLISGLKIKSGIDRMINRMVFSNYLIKLDVDETVVKSWKKVLPDTAVSEESIIEPEILKQSGIEQLSLFFESLIDETELAKNKGQWPYLLSFIEEVKKFELHHGSDVGLFLEDWDQRIKNTRIQMSDDAAKIRLYTIHKSKGLEFEVVLIPFGEWDFESTGKQNILWVEDQQDKILRLAGPLPVSYKSDLIYSSFDYALMSEYIRNVIDNLNLLYVAMTRPKKQLYIRLQEKESTKKEKAKDFDKPVTNTIDLFHMACDNLSDGVVTRGSKSSKSIISKATDHILKEKLTNYHLRHRPLSLHLKPSFDGATNESISQGLIIHSLLEEIVYRKDIQSAVSKSILSGDIRERDRDKWIDKLKLILDYKPVQKFYEEGWKVYNEKSIMVIGGGEYRPDRIQENGLEYVVIDYKTGQPNLKHHKQIKNYKSIIDDIVKLPVRGFIYYPLIPLMEEVS